MAVGTATLPSAEHRRTAPLWRAWRPTFLAVTSLVALSFLFYVLPALLGHIVIPGDDLTQSLPLRELVGRDLAAGHLPVYDPYLWAGAPLLAGWNAGAAYPLTWLFAVLPPSAAWTVTLAAAPIAAGVGCYAFLRANRLGAAASWMGGTTFAFGGGMAAQVSHIGLIAGMSWVPLGLLAILRLTAPPGAGRLRLASLAGWTAALATSVALVVLAGEPRAISDAATVLLLYGAWRLVRLAFEARRRDRGDGPVAWAAAGVVAGAALGVGLGAIQLVPGLDAVATSQRAAVTSFLFGAGSLPAPWLLLMGVPDLLGGSGTFGQPTFFASYNLTEVTGYVGMLPLVATGALLARIRTRLRVPFLEGPLPEWAIWYVVAAAGVVMALGTRTPLWHLLIRVPLFGGQRLQSRSILVTGLALAILLAYWADGWLGVEGPGVGAGPDPHPSPAVRRRERVLGTVLPGAVLVVVVVALAWRVPFLEWMGVPPRAAEGAGGIDPWLVPFAALALGAIAIAWANGGDGHVPGSRRERGTRRVPVRPAIVVGFVAVDLVLFAATTVVAIGAPAPAGPASAAPSAPANGRSGPGASAAAAEHRSSRADRTTHRAVRPIATLHLGGRFTVYDPTVRDSTELTELGVPDGNVLTSTPSAGGYGSIVDGHYAALTGTHGVSGTGENVFDPEAADNGVLDQLDTTAVLVPSSYLVSTDVDGSSGTAGSPSTAAPSGAGGRDGRTAIPGRPATWELGTPTAVTGATVTARIAPEATRSGASTPGPPATIRVGLEGASGNVTWSSAVTAGGRGGATGAGTGTGAGAGAGTTWRAHWNAPVDAVAVVVATPAKAQVEPPVLATAGGPRLRPSGALDAALVPPHWVYDGRDGRFAVYRNTRARPPLTLRAVPGGELGGATVTLRSGPALDPSSARVTSPRGAVVVRSVAAIPGWSATWTPSGGGAAANGRSVGLPVQRDGVVQAVRVPPGSGVLTWRYLAPGLIAGEAISTGALVLLLALALLALSAPLRAARRRREGGAPAGAP